jgi:probable HAF family extracellular repeat protein
MYLIRTALVAAGMLALGLPSAAPAVASTVLTTYHFRTLDNGADLTFNELLGINAHGKIAGYYGSGASSHPSKGYVLIPPYGPSDYLAENFPGSAQTQVTGLDDVGITVGFLSYTKDANPANNADYGFWARGGHYHKIVFPTADRHSPPVNQLLGVNNLGVAVGFYFDSAGNAHGYLYNIVTRRFTTVQVPGAVSVTATAINNHGAVAGYFTTTGGATNGFLRRPNGALVVLAKPGAHLTQAFGVSALGEVVGTYTIGTNTYGFTWTPGSGFATISDPNGVGSTFVNGVNNAGDLVGFFVGRNGNTNGMLAIPG